MTSANFSKASRLITSDDFLNLRKGAKCASFPYIRIFFKKSEHPQSRVGISASKKTGCAVKRNRYKRIIRESFRLSPIKNQCIDFIVVVSPRIKNIVKNNEDSKVIKESLEKFFSRTIEKCS